MNESPSPPAGGPPPGGGPGELRSPFGPDGLTTRSELQLVSRCIKGRWPITDHTRRRLAERLAEVVDDEAYGVREMLVAARTLILADAQNLEQEKRDDKIPDRIDVTTNGEKLPGAVFTLTAADLAATRDLLRGLGMEG